MQLLSALAKNPKSLALGDQRMAERSQRTGVNKERINFKREEQPSRVQDSGVGMSTSSAPENVLFFDCSVVEKKR
ncbi:hypothetical protein [Paenibacillus nasutitermitis]|uniref:hypothetical protein n=1 Tax=Paenibacillus nasutitermitis TaxID=1652958 RepID=UPI0016638372|nr:hypothetical protein [Paenibacillus nasutitermitis]